MKTRYDSYKPSGIDWIGEIPSHWEIVPIKSQGVFMKGLTFTKADLIEEGIPVISYGQVHSKSNNQIGVKKELIRFIPAKLTNPTAKVSAGDFIFADTSEDLEGCGNAVYINYPNEIYAGYHTIVFRSKSDWNAYLGYQFLTAAWRSQIRKSVSGVKVYSITQSIISATSVIIPPLAEQEAIAAWLDEKCGEIDAAIAKVDREIELIDELKQSEISRVVTRGLNPNVPLRSSGIDWIGEIPEHWIIAPFKRAMTINNGCDYKHIVCEDGYPVIGSGGQFAYASDYLYDGEVLLLGRKGTIDRPMHFIGKFWTVDTMFYAVPNDDVCCKFMYYQSIGFPFDYYSTATALPSMAASDLVNNPIAVPPFSEQREIADYLDKKCAEIDGLKAKLKKKRDTLAEFRQSLISEVVTGKRKVV